MTLFNLMSDMRRKHEETRPDSITPLFYYSKIFSMLLAFNLDYVESFGYYSFLEIYVGVKR